MAAYLETIIGQVVVDITRDVIGHERVVVRLARNDK